MPDENPVAQAGGDMLDPFAHWEVDDLENAIAALQDLRDNPGWRLVMDEIMRQHDSLSDRLKRTNDHDDMLRTQGAIRAVADMVEVQICLATPNTHEALRHRLIAYFQGLIEDRKADIDARRREDVS